jgi:hypothetical protein
LVYFIVIWYIFPRQEKSGNPVWGTLLSLVSRFFGGFDGGEDFSLN